LEPRFGNKPAFRTARHAPVLFPVVPLCDTGGMNQPLARMMRPFAGLFGVR
jgi:hypothetical protein